MRPISRYLACTPARRRRFARSGKAPAFTLLELIVVIVILAILALLAIPTFTGVIRKSKDATAEATLSALGRDVAALAALNGGTITTSDVKTAVSELPSSAAAPGRFASGTAYSVTSGTSSAPGQIAYDIASGGSKAGLAEVAPSGDVVYALASTSGVQTWVGCSAATGAEALGGPSGTSACSSGSSSSAQGSGGATVIGSTTTTTTSGTVTVSAPSAATSDSGGTTSYTVPSGASVLSFSLAGAQGANPIGGTTGGLGGSARGYLPVTAGETLTLVAGATGGAVGSGAGDGGGAGGGASVIKSGSTPLVVAGGGGGAGYGTGGSGGYPAGSSGSGSAGGAGGSQTTGGSSGGGLLQGGASTGTDGGGGGGGYYGGGGGGAFGGGGGGSSWAEASAKDVTYANGVQQGAGVVIVKAYGALPPTNLTASYNSSTKAVTLSWAASPSSNVTGYVIYRNGTQLTTVAGGSTTSYSDATAPQGQAIGYKVAATTAGLTSPSVSATAVTGTPAGLVAATNGMPGYVLAGPVTTSASSTGSGSSPSYAFDDTLNDYWNGGGFSATASATQPTAVPISKVYVDLVGTPGATYTTVDIYGTTNGGTSWTLIGSSSSDAEGQVVTIDVNQGSYDGIRIGAAAAGTWVAIQGITVGV